MIGVHGIAISRQIVRSLAPCRTIASVILASTLVSLIPVNTPAAAQERAAQKPPPTAQGERTPRAPNKDAAAKNQAAACARTITEFVSAVDAVLSKTFLSMTKPNALLEQYFPPKDRIKTSSWLRPFISIEGCDINQIIAIAKRSRFYNANRDRSRDHDFVVDFISLTIWISFMIDLKTGDIYGPSASSNLTFP